MERGRKGQRPAVLRHQRRSPRIWVRSPQASPFRAAMFKTITRQEHPHLLHPSGSLLSLSPKLPLQLQGPAKFNSHPSLLTAPFRRCAAGTPMGSQAFVLVHVPLGCSRAFACAAPWSSAVPPSSPTVSVNAPPPTVSSSVPRSDDRLL